MTEKSVTIFEIYPSIAWFKESYCSSCTKDCTAPSFEMFACVLKKLDKTRGRQDEQQSK